MSITEEREKENKLNEWRPEKKRLSLNWIRLSKSQKNRHFATGDIFYCDLGENIGYEITKSRPVIVLSDSHYNKNGMVIVAPLTKNLFRHKTTYFLKKEKYDFLECDSCVKTSQMRSVASIRMTTKLGKVDSDDLRNIKSRIKILFNF
ncbi:type II toxin-antitoxin system PemK/MazF family toxin [Lactococcus lactis]|uniref:mRNA interferase MazF n=1 Tax=Lactococcus lactis TaxID=1358 RepID=A0AAW5TTG6_9LACT|nr:type II toxin-antitoxin system PemK/MazF family toxin [Lactococcus lactis]MCW2282163.1 mRNA interferase MazF [Lactococcus lactis]